MSGRPKQLGDLLGDLDPNLAKAFEGLGREVLADAERQQAATEQAGAGAQKRQEAPGGASGGPAAQMQARPLETAPKAARRPVRRQLPDDGPR